MKQRILALSLTLALAACAASSYQRAPLPSQDVEITSPSVTRIYLMRMPQAAGAVRGVRIKEDSREIGRIGADSYLCWERAPGRSVAELDYEGPKIERANQGVAELEGEAGQVVYYGITIDTAWNRPIVRLLRPEEAREILSKLSPAPAH